MLHKKEISRRSNYCELHVRIVVTDCIYAGTDLDGFMRAFEYDIARLKRVNTSTCADWYKCQRTGNMVEVWHLDVRGTPDRKLYEITDDGKPRPDPFSFL